MSWQVGASTVLFVLALNLWVWSVWTYRGLPSLLIDPDGFRRARRTAEGRMLLALVCVMVGLALIGQWLAAGVTAAPAAVFAVNWLRERPARYARDRPPGGGG
jgi:hypothetical protein